MAWRGHLSPHALVSLYVVSVFVVDFGDVPLDYWLNVYDLPARLLSHPASDQYLGIVFSDGMIFPLVGIIFACYATRYRRPWLLSFLFAALLGMIELAYVWHGSMVYHRWSTWYTAAFAFVMLRLLAMAGHRFFDYTPPIAYGFRLLCFTYTLSEWPGAILDGVMHRYQWRLHIFANPYADDRFAAMALATLMGGLAGFLAPRTLPQYRFHLFPALGAISALLALGAHRIGVLHYHGWSDAWTVVRYVSPWFVIGWYDRWESAYTERMGVIR